MGPLLPSLVYAPANIGRRRPPPPPAGSHWGGRLRQQEDVLERILATEIRPVPVQQNDGVPVRGEELLEDPPGRDRERRPVPPPAAAWIDRNEQDLPPRPQQRVHHRHVVRTAEGRDGNQGGSVVDRSEGRRSPLPWGEGGRCQLEEVGAEDGDAPPAAPATATATAAVGREPSPGGIGGRGPDGDARVLGGTGTAGPQVRQDLVPQLFDAAAGSLDSTDALVPGIGQPFEVDRLAAERDQDGGVQGRREEGASVPSLQVGIDPVEVKAGLPTVFVFPTGPSTCRADRPFRLADPGSSPPLFEKRMAILRNQ